MDRDIDALKNALETYSSVRIGAIGSLYRTEDGRLTFQPKFSAESTMSQLGCTPISLTDRISEVQQETLVDSPAHPSNSLKSDKYYYIPIHKTFANIAASVIIILAVTIGILSYPRTSRYASVQASVMPVEKVLRLHSNEYTRHLKTPAKTERNLQVTTASADNRNINPLDTLIQPAERTLCKFNLVVGAFATRREADRYINSNTDSSSLFITKRGRHYLVVYATSDDRRTIISLLNSKDIDERYHGAWIWETKK